MYLDMEKEYKQIKNREITEKDRQRLNKTFVFLKKGGTKMELALELGLTGAISTVERTSRDYISMVAKDFPVISTSTSASKYCLAINYQIDLEKAKQCHNELIARANEIMERVKPLVRFIKEAESGKQGIVDFKEWRKNG